MNVIFEDLQAVSETETTLFDTIQPSPVSALVLIENVGTQDVKYRFDYWNGTAWVALGADGTDWQNVLSHAGGATPVRSVTITSSYPRWRMRGNGWTGSSPGGTSTLKFAVMQALVRASGATIPIISL